MYVHTHTRAQWRRRCRVERERVGDFSSWQGGRCSRGYAEMEIGCPRRAVHIDASDVRQQLLYRGFVAEFGIRCRDGIRGMGCRTFVGFRSVCLSFAVSGRVAAAACGCSLCIPSVDHICRKAGLSQQASFPLRVRLNLCAISVSCRPACFHGRGNGTRARSSRFCRKTSDGERVLLFRYFRRTRRL